VTPDASANLKSILRTLQERYGQTVVEMKIQSNLLLETERSLRELQEDREISERLKLRLESQLETQSHQLSILEDRLELQSKELKTWKVLS
jgi:hypothetical protein